MLFTRQAFLVAALTLATAGVQAGQKPTTLAVGDRVPDFSVTDLAGKTRKLSDLQKDAKSGIVMLTYWCSFCHSCRHVEATLDRVSKSYKGQAAVLALDSSAGETAEGITAFVKEKGLSLPIVIDPDGKTTDMFGVRVTTSTLIIDRDRVLRYRGRFVEEGKTPAEDALKAVLAGQTVPVKETALKG